jgi:L-fuconolactonase
MRESAAVRRVLFPTEVALTVNVPVIDIHPHVIAADAGRYPRAPLGGHQSTWSQERPVGVEQLIVEQDRAGIRKAALVQASTCYGHDNSYVADAVSAYPERFTGVFSCDVLAPDACDTMAYWMDRGLTGLRLFTTGSTMPGQAGWLDDPRSFPAWRKAEDAGLPVCLQMTADGIPAIEDVLQRFPRLSVVLDHLARPVQDDGPPYAAANSLWRLARFPGVYLKVTERNFVGASKGKATPDTFFGRLVSEFGASRIAWGSNFPASERSLADLLALAQDALRFLPQPDREWIFSRTAQTLYPALANHQ